MLAKNKNNKNNGQILVLVAVFLLFVGLPLAALSIDVAYFFHTKHQLQGAADAAALAGAAVVTAEVDGPSTVAQSIAREQAKAYASKNSAAGLPVIVASDGTNILGSSNDIQVGFWNTTSFYPATGNSGLNINAVKVVARRDDVTEAERPKVATFFGKIFGISKVSVSTSAIAARVPPLIGITPTCLPSCGLKTPISGRWGFNKNPDCDQSPYNNDPILSTDEELNNNPPGQMFYLGKSEEKNGVRRPGLAWANLNENAIMTVCQQTCNGPQSQDLNDFITGNKIAPSNICGKYLCTTNGTVGTAVNTLQDEFNKKKKQYTFTVGANTYTITGWEIVTPVVSDETCGTAGPCPGAQAGTSNPYKVSAFSKMLITEVSNNPQGIRIVGLNNPQSYTFTYYQKQGNVCQPITKTRIITTLGDSTGNCITCPAGQGGSPPELFTVLRLVK